MTITEFLLARIAEDEARARDAFYDGQQWIPEEEAVVAADHDLEPILYLDRKRDAIHAAKWSPARVLAECAAKRAIVERHPIQERPRLSLASSRHDLPPSWDGVPVEWSEWSTGRTTLIYHAPPESLACDQCGAVDEPTVNFGKRPPEDGATFASTRTKKTKKSGREYTVATEIPAWAIWDLVAARCRHCGHDVVTDRRTDERWDLDESDYGSDGSNSDGLW